VFGVGVYPRELGVVLKLSAPPTTERSRARYGKWKLCTCVAVRVVALKEYSSIHTRPSARNSEDAIEETPYAFTSAAVTCCTRDTRKLPAVKGAGAREAEVVGDAVLEDVAETDTVTEPLAVADPVAVPHAEAEGVPVAVADADPEELAEGVPVQEALVEAEPVAE
jgi:hypothetical protein